MRLGRSLFLIFAIFIVSVVYIVPWTALGVSLPISSQPYRLGLDLHGGVELDYKVETENIKASTGITAEASKKSIIEGVKAIIEKRVNSLGLAEPTIQTASYGWESHIIVQIPTQDHRDLSPDMAAAANAEDIKKAKETIGKVVKLEFREEKGTITAADKAERAALSQRAYADIQSGMPFATAGAKYRDTYEMVLYKTGSGSLPTEAMYSGVSTATVYPYTSPVFVSEMLGSISVDEKWNPIDIPGERGYSIVRIESTYAGTAKTRTTGTGATEKTETYTEKQYVYSYIFFSERPSMWTPAKTVDGRVLNDQYLTQANGGFSQIGRPEVILVFNDEGAKIFAELTKRLVGKQMAIFVGGEMLTNPTINEVIPNGRASITGDYTLEGAKSLANNIMTGIVPAPIYLTSERTIDAKIGADALNVILRSALIGLLCIVVFLVVSYRVSGLLAGLALVIYACILVALVKFFGIVLTLASIAGIVLSIGLAIDANILIFERMKEELRAGADIPKAIRIGFEKSWTAIWDSHVTSLVSAVILYWVGISLIKGFGLMLGLGIVLSLFTAMWVSRILIVWIGAKMSKNVVGFVGKI